MVGSAGWCSPQEWGGRCVCVRVCALCQEHHTVALSLYMVVWCRWGVIITHIAVMSCCLVCVWRTDRRAVKGWRESSRWLQYKGRRGGRRKRRRRRWQIRMHIPQRNTNNRKWHICVLSRSIEPSHCGECEHGETERREMKSILILEWTHLKPVHLPPNAITADELPALMLLYLNWCCWHYTRSVVAHYQQARLTELSLCSAWTILQGYHNSKR